MMVKLGDFSDGASRYSNNATCLRPLAVNVAKVRREGECLLCLRDQEANGPTAYCVGQRVFIDPLPRRERPLAVLPFNKNKWIFLGHARPFVYLPVHDPRHADDFDKAGWQPRFCRF